MSKLERLKKEIEIENRGQISHFSPCKI